MPLQGGQRGSYDATVPPKKVLGVALQEIVPLYVKFGILTAGKCVFSGGRHQFPTVSLDNGPFQQSRLSPPRCDFFDVSNGCAGKTRLRYIRNSLFSNRWRINACVLHLPSTFRNPVSLCLCVCLPGKRRLAFFM